MELVSRDQAGTVARGWSAAILAITSSGRKTVLLRREREGDCRSGEV